MASVKVWSVGCGCRKLGDNKVDKQTYYYSVQSVYSLIRVYLQSLCAFEIREKKHVKLDNLACPYSICHLV